VSTLPTNLPQSLPRIGFIGLGIMGAPMAGHLASAGYPLTVFDLDPVALRRFCDLHPHAVGVAHADEVGNAEIVMTMLPDGHQVQQVAIGSAGLAGLASAMSAGALLLDTSSAQPWLTVETAAHLSEHGISMVDAPVSGAQWGAEQADLVFMVGGTNRDVERVRPILDTLGRAIFHCGPLGAGHTMKSINNTITAMTLLATAEGFVLGKRAGLDPVAMNAVLNQSTGGSWVTENHIGKRILSGTYDDPFRLELMLKDISIATQLADDLDLELPFATKCESEYRAAHTFAGAGKSLSELVRWVEQTTGVTIVTTGAK
jgi:3-hydroxyisobutyrate dehydrogenase